MAKMSGIRDRVAALEAAVHDLQRAVWPETPAEPVEEAEPVEVEDAEPVDPPARRRGSRGR